MQNILVNNSIHIFLSAYGTNARIDHMLGNKLSLNRFYKVDILQSIFGLGSQHHSDIKARLRHNKKTTDQYPL